MTAFLSAGDVAGWIADGATVLDARGARAWAQGHVEGAAPVHWRDLLVQRWVPRLRTGVLSDDADFLQARLRAAGVGDGRPVVVVGAGPAGWGEEGRLAWTLAMVGHERVGILDGGVAAWPALTTSSATPRAGDLMVRWEPRWRTTVGELATRLDAIGRGELVVWDTREPREFAGATPYGEVRGGHVPGARSLWVGELWAPDGRLRSRTALRELLERSGVLSDRPVVTVCTGGVRSGLAWAALRWLGMAQAANCDGSMWDWARSRDLPLVKSG